MRTARRMSIECVAVYSDADQNAQHVKFADYAYRIGEAPALSSYLCIDKILDVASRAGAQAIHPGYGFLSENADFAEACQSAGVKFIGPSAQAIRDMGMKNRAKEIMIAAGVPTLDGYNGREQADGELLEQAKRIGFPVMIKPVCGGGGKGMRISHSADDFLPLLQSAQSESTKSFNNADMIIERFVERPRHVEVQVFGDQHGNYVHLWERDCSVQRRHQKIIEEAPAPGLEQEVRERLGKNAVDAARAVEYEGAGTVEFIMDTRDGRFYFMEMNTRLQVEHPVTEKITGVDLVEWQLRVARGEKLPKNQSNVGKPVGHAIETRIYAEAINPDSMDFMPSAGRLEYLSFPATGLARVDSGVVEGDEVSVHYDPMIAKVIVWAPDRLDAISRLDKALAETEIGGLPNNVDYVRACLNHAEFKDPATLSTSFIDNHRRELYETAMRPKLGMEQLVEGAVGKILLKTFFSLSSAAPFQQGNFFRLNTTHRRLVALNDTTWMEVEIMQGGSSPFHYRVRQLAHQKSYQQQSVEERKDGGERVEVRAKDVVKSLSDVTECRVVEFTMELVDSGKSWRAKAVQLSDSILIFGSSLPPRRWDVPERESHGGLDEDSGTDGSTTEARAPIPGVVEKVLVEVGTAVTRGQPLATLNAMKMEFVIKAPCDCIVESIECHAGQQVGKNARLVRFKPTTAEGDE